MVLIDCYAMLTLTVVFLLYCRTVCVCPLTAVKAKSNPPFLLPAVSHHVISRDPARPPGLLLSSLFLPLCTQLTPVLLKSMSHLHEVKYSNSTFTLLAAALHKLKMSFASSHIIDIIITHIPSLSGPPN